MSYPQRGEALPDGKCSRESEAQETTIEKIKSFFQREDVVFGDGVIELVPVDDSEKQLAEK